MKKLSQDIIEGKLEDLSEWSLASDKLQRTYSFENFVQSMDFVKQIATIAEQVEHHPDILIRYNKVTLTLSTHDAGGLTEKDFDFAVASDGLMAATAGEIIS